MIDLRRMTDLDVVCILAFGLTARKVSFYLQFVRYHHTIPLPRGIRTVSSFGTKQLLVDNRGIKKTDH